MKAILNGLKAIYDFLCGDAFILVMTAAAFIAARLLVALVNAPNVLVAIVFVGAVVAGLLMTLARERNAR